MNRKDLNQIEYDGYMVHRYMEDLKKRFPKTMWWSGILIVVFVMFFACYGFLSYVAMIVGLIG